MQGLLSSIFKQTYFNNSSSHALYLARALRGASTRRASSGSAKATRRSVGKVAASRVQLLESNRHNRLREGVRQQFALDEKARRRAVRQEEHSRMLAERYVVVPTGAGSSVDLFRDDSFRLLARGGSTARLRDARMLDQRLVRASSASSLRPASSLRGSTDSLVRAADFG